MKNIRSKKSIRLLLKDLKYCTKKKSRFGNETIKDAIVDRNLQNIKGKNIKTGLTGELASAAGGSGLEGMVEISQMKKYLVKEEIAPLLERIKKLEQKNNIISDNKIEKNIKENEINDTNETNEINKKNNNSFGGIVSGIYYGTTGLVTTPGCFIKLNNAKSFLLKIIKDIDNRISKIENVTSKINGDIYNKSYKTDSIGKASNFLGGGFGGVCRNNILKIKRILLDQIKEFDNRIKILEKIK